MLEKLITNIKKSLPEPLRKKLGGEEEQEEEGEELEAASSESNEEEGEEEASSPDEEKKKKQKSMIIRVVVILALGYLAADQFLFKSGEQAEPSVEEILAKTGTKKPRKKKVEETTETTETTTATPPTAESVPPATTPSSAEGAPVETASNDSLPETTPSSSEVTPPVENVNITEKPAESIPPVVEAPPVAEAEKTVGESRSEGPGAETGIDQKIDQLIDKVEGPATTETEIKKPTLADKIVEDEVYTAPPSYEQVGRGLVYNCTEKFWACVDKLAYVTCNKNMKWNSAKGKTSECVIQNVYNTDEDCAKVQKYNVSTNQATTFCK